MLGSILLKNGKVFVDGSFVPSDLLIDNGKIKAIAADLSKFSPNCRVIDVKGYFVSPGFIDNHCHINYSGSSIGAVPNLFSMIMGCTTLCDAGSCGVGNYQGFHDNTVKTSVASIYAYLNIASSGQIMLDVPENYTKERIHADMIRDHVERFKGEIIGLKLRFDKGCVLDEGLESLVNCAELAHNLDLPLMVHIVNHPESIDEIMPIFERGDIVAHCFHNCGETILDERGKVRDSVLKARERGVLFEASDHPFNYSFDTIDKALKEGFLADILSTDLVNFTAFGCESFGLPYVMSKYLSLGVPLEKIIPQVSSNLAQVLRKDDFGRLAVGTVADVCVFKVEDDSIKYEASDGTSFVGNKLIVPQCTIKNGALVYASPSLYSQN